MQWTSANVMAFAVVAALVLAVPLLAQNEPKPPPDRNGPPRDDNGPPRDQNGPPRGDSRPLPPEQRALAALNLTDEQKQQVAPILQDFQRKQDALRDDLFRQMKEKLTPDQYRQYEASMRRPPPPGSRNPQSAAPNAQPVSRVAIPAGAVAVTLTGGHDTDPRDGGRPVILVASALNVPANVFRETFTHVKPARGAEPEPEQVRLNKQALMAGLGPYGVTDDRLNEVSNYYRYAGSKGEMWRNVPAEIYATVRDGAVTGFTIVNPGAGYSSPPMVSIPGMANLTANVTLGFGTDLATNGCVKEVRLGQ